MNSWIGKVAIGGCILLSVGVVHQRNAYLEAKDQRNAARSERSALQQQLGDATKKIRQQKNDHAKRKKLVQQWLEYRGSAAFQGGFAGDDYVSIMAKVRHASPVPDPLTSPYTDCLTELEIESFKFGEEDYKGEKMIGVINAFKDRALTPEALLKVGDIIHCVLIPENHINADIKKIQRVSTVEDFTLDTMYLAAISRMGQGKPEQVPISTFENPLGREAAIAKDLERINRLLAKNGGNWENWHKQTEPFRNMLRARLHDEGEDITIDERLTFRNMNYLDGTPSRNWPAPQLAMLNSMQSQLAERGVDLIVVPIPSKEISNWPYFIDARPADNILMPYRLFFYQQILEAGIEVIDTAPALRAAWEHYPQVYYDGDDDHPADGAIQVVADAIAERLARYEFEPQVEATWRLPFTYRIPTGFDLFPESAMTSDRYQATRVMTLDLQGVRDTSVNRSPLLLASDSFGSVPYEYGVRNANLVSHISCRVGIPMYHKQVGGGGPRMLRHMAMDRHDLLANRRVCVFLFSERFMFHHARGNAKHNWTVVDLPKAPEDTTP